jgi:putative transposase
VTEIYEFIDGEKGNYPLTAMCAWMAVSRSGFYEWRDKPVSATVERRDDLKARITRIFTDTRRT